MAERVQRIPDFVGSLFGLIVLSAVANIFPSRYRIFPGPYPNLFVLTGLTSGFSPYVTVVALTILTGVFSLVVAKRAVFLRALGASILMSLFWAAFKYPSAYGHDFVIPYAVEFFMMLAMVFATSVGVGLYLHFLFGGGSWKPKSLLWRYRGKRKPYMIIQASLFVLLIAQLGDIASGGGVLMFLEAGVFCIGVALTLDALYCFEGLQRGRSLPA